MVVINGNMRGTSVKTCGTSGRCGAAAESGADDCRDHRQPQLDALGSTIRHWRVQRELPQKALATDLGVSVSTVNKWESGERFPSAKNLVHLAVLFKIPICRFFCQGVASCVMDHVDPSGGGRTAG